MARTRSVDFLPQIFQTPVNKQFLGATLDTLVQEPKFKKTQGFIGRTVGPGVNPNDSYVIEPSESRQEYQLEPGVIILEPDTNKVKDAITYPGINDAIGFQGGDQTRPDLLYRNEYYTWDPFINYDAFINFSQYFWLPNGPDVVEVGATGVPTSYNFTVTRENGVYTFSGQTGNNPTIDLVRGGSYTFQVAQNAKETENFRVTNQGTTSYQIDFQSNPTLTLARGNTYVFNLNLNGAYPFWIKTQQSLGTGDAYNSGVSRNGSEFGLVTFVVPQDAPDTLYYVSQNQTNLRGTINIVNSTPGTGPGFWIQTNPGVSGKNPNTPNISSREVYGVSNNGEDLGTVIFEVPSKTAQEFYYNLTDVGPIDLLTDLQFNQINNQQLEQFVSQYGGIDGITYLNNRTLVFTNTVIDAEGGGWLETTLFDPLARLDSNNNLLGSYDSLEFDQDTVVPVGDRYQVWQINIVNRQGIDYISLAKVANVNVNEKFTVLYGNVYSNTSWYKAGSGYFSQIPLLTATLDTLYYQDGTDPEMFGRIRLLEQTQADTIYIDQVIGQKNYTSPNGVQFTNGLKVKFTGLVEPASYGSGTTQLTYTATVSGGNFITCTSTAGLYVGEAIVFTGTTLGGIVSGQTYYVETLTANGIQFAISEQPGGARFALSSASGAGFLATAISDKQYYVSGVGTAIELLPVSNFITPETYVTDANDSTIAVEPKDLDYLTINRASLDLNAWTRSNRWFHLDVIQASATYNNVPPVLDNDYRAKRPIIEFQPGLRLFNMGTESKQPVNVIDFSQTDALSNIEGSTGYSVDGYSFVDGSRVVFAADLDPEVRNKVYIVQFIAPDSSPPMSPPYPGPQPVIHLVEASDGTVLADQSVLCLDGTTLKGLTFWYNGASWTQAQLKTGVQQAPLFDVYNLDGVSFSNNTTYPSSTFVGSKLLSYAVGDSGVLDPILQFPLQYLNINNIGDIVFENNLYKDTFVYVVDNVSQDLAISSGTPRQYATRTVFERQLGWKRAVSVSQNYQQFKFTYTGRTLQLDVKVETTSALPPLKIYVGSNFITPSEYSYLTNSNSTTITLSNTYLPTDVIEVLALSDQTSAVAFYQVPSNLQNNPLNGNSDAFTLGTIRTHYESICENLSELSGPISGANNSRDLGDIGIYGQIILQQSAPLTLAGYFLRSEKFNIFASLQYNMQEYLKFKGQMLNAVTQQTIQYQTTAQILDTAMSDITLGRTSSQPFYWSDMLPAGDVYQTLIYTISNTTGNTFDIQNVYNYGSANYQGMDVYLNDVILTRGLDYIVATDGPRITVLATLTLGDVLTINEYDTTYGTFVPNTPTKLGLYPAWRPRQVTEVTSTGSQSVIIGHDGSVTRAFNDIRDQVLLEFETRIYNNLKLDGNPVPINLTEVIPGQFRTTGFSSSEITTILEQDFLSYVAWNKLDYRAQDFRVNNEFTWNYSGSQSKLDDQPLLGAWRGIYRYYYDTQQPALTPWEMLGFSVEPDWWTVVYGSGPYTQDNLVLWDDLEAGYVADPVAPYYLPAYARPGLSKVIPTGPEGELLSPFDAVTGKYNDQTFRKSWVVGDGGPVEASWWNSSAYPFAAMRLLALTQPAKFFALFADRDLYRYQAEFEQYLYNDRYRLDANGIEVYGNGVSKASYIDWIVDYNRNSGLDSTTQLTADLASLDVRLCYRMASFSDKQYIKIYTEKSSPNSVNTTFLIPDDSYNLLLYKNQPFDRVSYSSVVIQQTPGGYAVFGYSTTQPYFNTLGSVFAGQLQTYSSGGVTVQVPTTYSDQIVQVPYSTIFANETAVSDFLLGYGQYLERQGVTFEDTTNGYILSWGQMVNEFLYWSQQGWDDNALINLNPLAFKLSVTRPQAIVDSIVAQTNENILLDQNRNELPTRNLIITRLDNTFTVEPATDQTLSYIDLKYTAYEHMIVLDNASTFGDLIYAPITGARQSRLNLIAATTTEWNGSVDAQGFILNQNNIEAWDPYKTYAKGEIVTYKGTYWSAATIVQPSELFNANDWYQSDYTRIELGLLPNLANKADQLQNSYNINSANLESDNDLLSYGLIGFRPRQYMSSLNLDDVSQLNVYRQFLGSKGTILSAELFAQANLGKEQADYNIYENWAVQRAVYGANANRSFFQLRLNRALLNSNPGLVQVVNAGETSQADQPILLSDIWRQSYKITTPDILPVTKSLPTDTALPTAGYVNLNDADITVFDINDTASLEANLNLIAVGTTIWVAKTNQYDWDIYRAEAVPGTVQHVCDNLDGTSLVIFSQQHGLASGDRVIIKQFDFEVDGVYTVISVPSLTKITIAFSFTGNRTIVNGTGLAFTLQTQRVAQASDIINLPYANTIQPGATVWVDNNGNDSWTVLQKEEVFSSLTELAPVLSDLSEQYSSSVAQAQRQYAAIVGSPQYRFPVGATEWSSAEIYNTGDIVFVRDPYQTAFYQYTFATPFTPPPGPVPTNATYWAPYSLDTLPRKGGVYVYVRSDSDTYTVISPLAPLDSVLTLDGPGVRGFGNTVAFGNKDWAVAGASASLGSAGQASNGYAAVIYRDPLLAAPGSIPYGPWQLLTTPDSVSVDQGEFGYSATVSLDERWMYIGAPGVNRVYAYGQVPWEKQFVNGFGDGSTKSFYIGDAIQINAATQLQVGVGGAGQILNVDYTVDSTFSTVTFTNAPITGTAIEIQRVNRKILDYGVFYNVTATGGTGTGAEFTVTRLRNTVSVSVSSGGTGYANGSPSAGTLTISAASFDGNANIVMQVTVAGGAVTGIFGTPTYAGTLVNTFSLNEYFFTVDTIYSFSVQVNDVLQRPNIDYTFNSTTKDLTFLPTIAGNFGLGIEYTIITVGTTDFTAIGAASNTPGITFTATGTGTGTGTAQSPATGATILVRAEGYFEYAGTISHSGSTVGDRFGSSVSTSTDGRQVLIGGEDVLISGALTTVSTSGLAAVGTNTYTNIAQNSTSGSGTGARFTIAKAANNYTVTITDPGQGYVVGDTITIFGSVVGGSVLYNNLTITVVSVTSYAQAGTVYVYDRNVQKFIYGTDTSSVDFTVLGTVTQPVSVLVNGEFLLNAADTTPHASNTFTVSGNTVTINGNLQIGDIIEIETNQFAQTQIIRQNALEEFSNFGQALDLCSYNCSLYVGAPQSGIQAFKGGVVQRNVNQSRVYGIITSTVGNPVLTVGNTLRVNNIDVAVPASPNNTVTNLASAINAAVPNVNATVDGSGRLTLAVKNSAAAAVGDKLQVAPGSVGTVFSDLGLDVFAFTQTILSPYPQDFAAFGASVSIDDSAINLVVGAPQGTLYLEVIFDLGETIFDEGVTDFFDQVTQSGSIYTYDLLPSSTNTLSNPSKLVFGQQIQNSNVNSYDRYGASVDYTSGLLWAGAPGNELGDSTLTGNYGRVFISENATRTPAWTVLREQLPVVDVRLLNSVYAYDRVNSTTTSYFDFFNPLQGKILGAAKQNLDYIGAVDPANYNVGPRNITGSSWFAEYLGQTWWDTGTVRFIDPNQDDIVYASRRWGQIFPGSSIDVYQWIVSDVPPANYVGPGIPRDTTSYTVNIVLNQTGIFVREYYFWVRGLTTTATAQGKTLPISTVSNYIADPRASGIPYIAPLNASTFAIYNATDIISAQDTIISIEFDREYTNDDVHVEYELIAQDQADGWLSDNLYRKLLDSFCGVDIAGNLVPDINLNVAERYGVQFRPRQSMFVDRFAALKNYLTRANDVCARYTISENREFVLLNSQEPEPSATSGDWNKQVANLEILGFQNIYDVALGYKYLVTSDSNNRGLWTIYTVQLVSGTLAARELILTRVQNYDTRQYWNYINWIMPGYNPSNKIIAEVPNYAGLSTTDVPTGSSVKVIANAQGKYEIYLRTVTGWDRVVLQDGTIEFSAELWDYALGRFGWDSEVFDAQYFDQEPVIETRKIIQAINQEIFIDELLIERNRALTLMFNFVLSEFAAPEWLIKTSLIDVEHRIRSLLPFQNYSRDNQEFVLDYIQEVKPYHVQIRAFNLLYNGFNEWFGDMTDFDVPAYYNTALDVPQYTSPILLPYDLGTAVNSQNNILSDLPSNSTVWSLWPYSQWYQNYLMSIDTIDVIATGSGYTEPPEVVITTNPSDPAPTRPAVAVALLNSLGQVYAINVIDSGEGYRSTPTVTFDGGNGTGAVAYPRLINGLTRSFKTVIRYDRYQYQTAVQTWSATGNYLNGTLVRYNDRVWSASSSDGSSAVTGPIFDLENWTLVNAANYTYPGASQATGLTGVDRTAGLYVPAANSPGLELPLLIDGIDYPGVQVYGNYFLGSSSTDPTITCTATNSSDNTITCAATLQLAVGNQVKFSGSVFGGIQAGVTYYVYSVVTANTFVVSTSEGGFALALTDAVGTMTVQTAILLDADYQSSFLDSYLGTQPSDINVDGGEFVGPYEGHAPEELINGSEFDTLDMRIYTRPGSDWELNGHGFQITSVRYTYEPGISSTYSWADLVQVPTQVLVSNLTTGIDLIQNINYSVNWADQTIEIISGVAFLDIININVYEAGGGSQLFRKTYFGSEIIATNNNVIIPVAYKEIVSVPIFVNGNIVANPILSPYTVSISWALTSEYQALDVVLNNSTVTCTGTNSTYNIITCNDTSELTIGQPIVFSGTVFGGIASGVEYYVLTVANGTQFLITDVAGSTTALSLTTASGSMIATPTGTYYRATQTVPPGILLTNTAYWLPFVPSNYTKVAVPVTVTLADLVSVLALGDASSMPVTEVVGTSNAVILQGDLSTISVGQTVSFSGYSLGGVLTNEQYQIFSIVEDSTNAITLSLDGITEVDLLDDQAQWLGELTAKFIPTDFQSWSTPVVENFVAIDEVFDTNSVTLSASLSGTNVANMIVEINGIRIQPPEGIEWIGDDSSVSFGLPQRGGYQQDLIYAPDQVQVWVDNVLQVQSVGATVGTYGVTNWDGSNTPGRQVVFGVPPAAGARILISVTTVAAYDVAGNTIQFNNLLSYNDKITVTTWNDTAQQNALTLVFVGPITTGLTVNEPYDSTNYDSGSFDNQPGSFDYTIGTSVPDNNFDLARTDVVAGRLWVTLDGMRLFEGTDYTVQGQYLILASGAIGATQVMVVTEFTDSIVPEAAAFRIFQDMRGVQATYRMTAATTTVLAQNLSATADIIHVEDAAKLTQPNLASGVFGTITINGERILYRNIDLVANTISGLRRGTAGTAASSHLISAEVYDLGTGNLLNEVYQNYVVSNSSLADGSTTIYYAPNIDIGDFGDSSTAYTESIEVYVGGIRQYNYSETQATSEYRYIVTDFSPLAIEFVVDNNPIAPMLPPAAGSEVLILQRRGLSWYQPGVNTASDGVALQETNTVAARFLCDR